MNPYLDIALRSAAVYIFMLLAISLSGKKELSRLNTTDVVQTANSNSQSKSGFCRGEAGDARGRW
ncbi:MAG TPA: hypothetical protein VF679_00370 [Pedobacter sp.]|jgi:hypothetical protein